MGTIVQLQNKVTGENQYPRTYTTAVIDENATPLSTLMEQQDDKITELARKVGGLSKDLFFRKGYYRAEDGVWTESTSRYTTTFISVIEGQEIKGSNFATSTSNMLVAAFNENREIIIDECLAASGSLSSGYDFTYTVKTAKYIAVTIISSDNSFYISFSDSLEQTKANKTEVAKIEDILLEDFNCFRCYNNDASDIVYDNVKSSTVFRSFVDLKLYGFEQGLYKLWLFRNNYNFYYDIAFSKLQDGYWVESVRFELTSLNITNANGVSKVDFSTTVGSNTYRIVATINYSLTESGASVNLGRITVPNFVVKDECFVVEEDVIKESDLTLNSGVNLANPDGIEQGRYIGSDGSIRYNEPSRWSIKIPVVEDNVISFGGFNLGRGGWGGFYDDTMSLIQKIDYTDPLNLANQSTQNITIPTGSKWMIITIAWETSTAPAFEKLMINYGAEIAAYEPFSVNVEKIKGYNVSSKIEQKETLSVIIPTRLKYPLISSAIQKKGCIAFQIDTDLPRDDYKEMLLELRKYGIRTMDFTFSTADINNALNKEHLNWMLKAQNEGCEIMYHNKVNSISDISESSSLTFEEGKNGLTEELNQWMDKGAMPYGIIPNNGSVREDFVPLVENIFLWACYGSGSLHSGGINYETTKEWYIANKRIQRTSADILVSEISEKSSVVIENAKKYIDNIIANKSMGVIYCHKYQDESATDYYLPKSVLDEIASYIKSKVEDGLLVTGSTTECLNYLLV